MGMPAARITDLHICPALLGAAAPIVTGCFTVITGSMPQARVTDVCACSVGTDPIVLGSFTVLVCGLPAARIADMTLLGGVISTGFFTVLIG
ncbi:MAG: PAAR domain-containing protein [Hyphomicrobiales bacterium]